ncbi:MAG: hypothetical protein B6226_04145 [Candidatus Cloacimonetes bacterium 4572_65]|nr:MAG: hypothetical protein B6226_04145 [Candidatus Cloacimonetes bacterium 4572_65]
MSTGIKTKNYYIGKGREKEDVKHLSEFLQERGKKIGVVTTVVAGHATPAGFVAHNEYRKNYSAIFRAMVTDSKLSVMMGAGFSEEDKRVDKRKYHYVGGKEFWNQLSQNKTIFDIKDGEPNEVEDIDNDSIADVWTFIRDKKDFLALKEGKTPKRVLGVFNAIKSSQYKRDGDKHADPFVIPFRENIPTLGDMSLAAMNIMDNKKGFWLMIEGGSIDKASHARWGGRMIEEEIEFNLAVEDVVRWIETNSSWKETILIVTADHETGHISGEPNMKNHVITDVKNRGKGNMPEFYFITDNHTNSLVPFFAKGFGASNFSTKATLQDSVRGKYMDNIDIAKTLFDMFE